MLVILKIFLPVDLVKLAAASLKTTVALVVCMRNVSLAAVSLKTTVALVVCMRNVSLAAVSLQRRR